MTPRTSRPSRNLLLKVCLPVLCCLAGPPAWADPLYTIANLGTLSGQSSSVATSINDRGQVVGVSYSSSDGFFGATTNPATASPPRFQVSGGGAESFLYGNGQITQISPTGGLAMSINDSSQVVGGPYASINSAGQYVGGSWSGVQDSYSISSQLVSGGTTTTLQLMPYAINNSGEIAGLITIDQGGTTTHPAVLENGQITDLFSKVVGNPVSGGLYDSRAIAINQNGDVLINVLPAFGTMSSYLYSASTGTAVNLTALPGASGFSATALNDKDQVVGNGLLYSNGTLQTLANLLPASSGWSNLNATAINDAGQIVGQGTFDNQTVAFLMTPDVTETPEPSALAIWGLIAASAAARALAKRRRHTPRGRSRDIV